MTEGIFEPRSIAVLGASDDPKRFGGRALGNLLRWRYSGRLFPINPKYVEVSGLPCHPTLFEVPDEIDMAMMALPAEAVLPALRECVEKGVKLAIVVSSGFAEAGGQGRELQNEMTALARRSGMRILGPNSLGFLNVTASIAPALASALDLPDLWPGPVSLLSQSGAIGFASVFSRGYENGIGFRYVFSTGNECDLDAASLLAYLVEDPGTRVIAALLEGIRDVRKFREAAAAAAAAGKPIVLLKVGRSEEGRRAAASHTAALAGSDDVHDAVFRTHGVVRVDDLDDLWEVPGLFASVGLPRGRRVAVVTTSGGLNGLLADHLRREELELPELAPESREELSRLLPAFGSAGNPLDLTGAFVGHPREAEVFCEVLRILDADPETDLILLTLFVVRRDFSDVLLPVVEAIRVCRKPVVLLSPGGSISEEGLAPLHRSGITRFRSPSRCARAIRHLCDYAAFQRKRAEDGQQRAPMRHSGLTAPSFGPGLLEPADANSLLAQYRIPVAQFGVTNTLGEAKALAAQLGYPVVLKAIAPGVVHKSDAGAVVLGVSGDRELSESFEQLRSRFGPVRVLVQEMVSSGVEMIVGVQTDPQFGPVVLVGSGGILVELVHDTALGLPPVDRGRALEMINGLRVRRLLEGFRGQPAADIEALVDVVVAVSHLAEDLGSHVEALDLNPVIVLPAGQGIKVVDTRVIWRDVKSTSESAKTANAIARGTQD